MYTRCIYKDDGVQTKIQKWGNSLGLRIPKALAEEAGVEAGSEVNLSIEEGGLIIRPVRRRKVRLRELLRRINSRNLHREIDTGAPVGREVW